MRDVAIVGIGHSKFGRRTDVDVAELAFESIKGAMEDSGVEKKEIHNVTLGSAGGWYEESLPAVLVNEYAGFEDVGTMRVEAACASGSAAVRSAYLSVASGESEVAMAVGRREDDRGGHADLGRADGEVGLLSLGVRELRDDLPRLLRPLRRLAHEQSTGRPRRTWRGSP